MNPYGHTSFDGTSDSYNQFDVAPSGHTGELLKQPEMNELIRLGTLPCLLSVAGPVSPPRPQYIRRVIATFRKSHRL